MEDLDAIKYRRNVPLSRKNTFQNPLLIIDGQGRSGKNLISILLTTEPRIEKMRLDSQFDYIPRYFALGKITLDAAQVALLTEFDEKLYYTYISRDVNFRLSDYSGVLKQGQKWRYIKRAFIRGEQEAVERINRENHIFQEMTHDGLHVSPLFFKTFSSRLKVIHVHRNPIRNIFEQNKRHFGSRFGIDPREFQLTFDENGLSVPIMAIEETELFIKAKPIEKILLVVYQMNKLNKLGYSRLNDEEKSRVCFIDFDKFVINPDPYLRKIESFLDIKFSSKAERLLKRENCPRKENTEEDRSIFEELEYEISREYRHMLYELMDEYKSEYWSTR